MDRQTLVDWVHAYNERGVDGLINATSTGRPAKLTDAQKAELKALVEQGPRLLHDLGFSHISARPQHPEQKEDAIATFKKRSCPPGGGAGQQAAPAGRSTL